MEPEFSHLLRCPADGFEVAPEGGSYVCRDCGRRYPVIAGVPVMLAEGADEKCDEIRAGLDKSSKNRVKETVKRWISPPKRLVTSPQCVRARSEFLKESRRGGGWLLNLAAGGVDYGERCINVDITHYPTVHVIGNAHRLPFADNSMSGLICEVSLYLFDDMLKSVDEMRRVLKPGGVIFITYPFLFPHYFSAGGRPLHLVPDGVRFTKPGLARQFGGFDVISADVSRGPSGTLQVILAEYAVLWGTILIRSNVLEKIIRTIAGWILAPIGYLDLILDRHPNVHRIARSFYYFGRLRDDDRLKGERDA